jgi:transcriptional regulator with XRE-family HTH domain
MTNLSVAPDSGRRRHVWTRGDRLRASRENMDGSPTQAEFARLMGCGRNTVVRYESDVPGTESPLVLYRWAQVTGFDHAWLVDGDGGDDPITGDCSGNCGHLVDLEAAA